MAAAAAAAAAVAAAGADGRRAALEAAAAAPERGGGSCVLCCGDLEATALGRCDHPVCYRCSTKMRVLCEQRYCAVCREELRQVRRVGRAARSGRRGGRGARPEGDFAFLVSGRGPGGAGFQKTGLAAAPTPPGRAADRGASGAGRQEVAPPGGQGSGPYGDGYGSLSGRLWQSVREAEGQSGNFQPSCVCGSSG